MKQNTNTNTNTNTFDFLLDDFYEGKNFIYWIVNLDQHRAYLESRKYILNKEEQLRADKFLLDIPRIHYTSSHVALRLLVSNYLGCPPHQLPIHFPSMNHPFLSSPYSTIKVSLSRSHGMAFIALSSHLRLGIDIERSKYFPSYETILFDHGSSIEKQIFIDAPQQKKESLFWRWWVSKEASLKAIGTGLSFEMSHFSCHYHHDKSFITSSHHLLSGMEIRTIEKTFNQHPYCLSVAFS